MKEPEKTPDASGGRRRLTRRGQVVITLFLIVVLLLAGFLFAQRFLRQQASQNSGASPTHPVQITPLTLPTPTNTATQPPATATGWATYHGNNARTGFVANAPNPTSLKSLWKHALDGTVYAEPLVVDGHVIAVTENDTLYALDASTGQIQWHTNVGRPVPLSDLPCGNIDPLGITGTPVYDPQTGLVFAVAEIEGPAHILVGVDIKTGEVKVRRVVDPPGIDAAAHQQRAALGLYGGRVYIAFGGLYGDCGNYHGLVVASRTDGSGTLLAYQVPTPREGGIWAPGGPTIDAQGNLYVSVGNGEVTQGNWDHTDSVLRLSPSLQLMDGFAPQNWQSDNAADLDLSSLGPVFLPDGLLFIQGKSNQGYLLRTNHLGGIGAQLQTISVCGGGAYGGAAVNDRVAFIPCTEGLREIQLGSGDRLTVGWQAPQQVTGSPIIGGNTVYSLYPSGGMLYALNAANGSVRASIAVGTTTRFATPTLYQKSLFVGTTTGITAVEIA
ncbi:MAG TPA: PQQ-binding-like beta-propeller repeat protein [Ktedonobacteraceae bacterium]|nr:PQQ-binding-like beta-propeller repeat protein [Ktedonobacteraceae bacterium]